MTINTKTLVAPKTRRERGRADATPDQPTAPRSSSKLDEILSLLGRLEGASMAELVATTGWQGHSVRGVLAGALKKKGHVVRSEKIDGERRYRIGAEQ
jgi:hypothetical protein